MIYYKSRLKRIKNNEVWLSLVEHYVRDVGAAGSNPVTSTSEKPCSFGSFLRLHGFFIFPRNSIEGKMRARFFQRGIKRYNKNRQRARRWRSFLCLFSVLVWFCLRDKHSRQYVCLMPAFRDTWHRVLSAVCIQKIWNLSNEMSLSYCTFCINFSYFFVTSHNFYEFSVNLYFNLYVCVQVLPQNTRIVRGGNRYHTHSNPYDRRKTGRKSVQKYET